MDITKNQISTIINDLGKNSRIYQREAQFQFELAWELQKKIGENGKVLLEVMSCQGKEDYKRRFYSDIIIQTETDEGKGFIVIELKYKTKKAAINGVELTGQGAQDLGRYGYLWDIKRIELLKNKEEDKYTYPELGKFLGGYAIMLTNDPQYWTKTKVTAKDTIDKEFCIGNGDIVKDLVDWHCEEEKKKKWMKEAIQLDGVYHFKWDNYYSDEHNDFKYLITEIKMNDNIYKGMLS